MPLSPSSTHIVDVATKRATCESAQPDLPPGKDAAARPPETAEQHADAAHGHGKVGAP